MGKQIIYSSSSDSDSEYAESHSKKRKATSSDVRQKPHKKQRTDGDLSYIDLYTGGKKTVPNNPRVFRDIQNIRAPVRDPKAAKHRSKGQKTSKPSKQSKNRSRFQCLIKC